MYSYLLATAAPAGSKRWLFQEGGLRSQLLNFPLELLQTSPFRDRQIRFRAAVGLAIFVESVAERLGADAICGGDVLDRFGGVDHLAA